ncbi:hypothetical protein CISIN_1g0274282mg, partial [Citrus sinensis]
MEKEKQQLYKLADITHETFQSSYSLSSPAHTK